MPKLFGFKFKEDDGSKKSVVSPVPENQEDSSDYYVSSGFYGQYVDIEGVYKSEFDLIKRYREMALHPEVDGAIEDVINEAIVSDQNDSPVEIDLENAPCTDKLKGLIREEFKNIKSLLHFDDRCHEILRNWYVDGRIYYHKVIDFKKPEQGIQELRYVDPQKIRHIRRIKKDKNNPLGPAIATVKGAGEVSAPQIEEYYEYDPNGRMGKQAGSFKTGAGAVTRISKDAITYVHSGLVDRNKNTVLSYLHKAIKALNQLRMIEDSLVIYRLSRAPERRIFYIDVGNLPKIKAEQYLREVMNRYRNKLVYDANTGEVRDDRKMMSMLEDFWLPRREGGRGTEITTLPGGQNLGELADIEYFQKKLYRALGVPESRLASGTGFNLGRSSEILRDEIKFTKFVGRMRKRFSQLFHDMLRTQLLLKNIVSMEDWDALSEHIQYDYVYDNHFSELKENELMNERVQTATALEPYIGRYYSADYVRRHVFKQTDQEIIEIDKQIKKEIKDGIIPDPSQPVDPNTGLPLDTTNLGAGGNPQDPEVDGSATELPDGGEI